MTRRTARGGTRRARCSRAESSGTSVQSTAPSLRSLGKLGARGHRHGLTLRSTASPAASSGGRAPGARAELGRARETTPAGARSASSSGGAPFRRRRDRTVGSADAAGAPRPARGGRRRSTIVVESSPKVGRARPGLARRDERGALDRFSSSRTLPGHRAQQRVAGGRREHEAPAAVVLRAWIARNTRRAARRPRGRHDGGPRSLITARRKNRSRETRLSRSPARGRRWWAHDSHRLRDAVVLDPSRSARPGLQHAQRACLARGREVADLLENSVPPCAPRTGPRAGLVAPVYAPASAPNSSACKSSSAGRRR